MISFRSLSLVALGIAAISSARAITFDVYAQGNSSSGGTGVATVALTAGQAFSVSVDPNDLWNAGPLPRWSNADGLVGDLYATGSDDSLQPIGTHIGEPFSLWTQDSFTAPYGSLVGVIGGVHILLGTNFVGVAPATGTLNLYYWDSNNGDNSEKITADVRTAVPDAGSSLALLGGAVVALGAFRRRSPGMDGR